MADITTAIDPDGTKDYASMNAWNTAEATDLVSAGNNHIVTCYSTAGSADSTYLTMADWTTDATHTVLIQNADTLDSEWDATAYRLAINAAISALIINDDNVTCSGIQFENINRRVCSVAGDNVIMENCIFRADTTYASGIGIRFIGTGTCYISNSLIYGFGTNGINDGIASDNGIVYIYNCTVVDIVDDGYSTSGDGTMYLKNCVAFNCGGSGYFNSGTMVADYCGYPDTDPGTNGVDLTLEAGTGLFEDYTNNVLRIKNSDSALYSAGLDLSGDGVYPISDDMGGQTRTTWDLGCDELFVVIDEGGGGGGSVSSIIRIYYRNSLMEGGS